MINLDYVVAQLNQAATELDNLTQQIANNPDTERAVVARLTQGVVLAGTAVEILGGLNNALKFAEQQAAASKGSDGDIDTTEESTEDNG